MSEMQSLLTAKSRTRRFLFREPPRGAGHSKKFSMGQRDVPSLFRKARPESAQIENYIRLKSQTLISGPSQELESPHLDAGFFKKRSPDSPIRVIRSFENLPFEVSAGNALWWFGLGPS